MKRSVLPLVVMLAACETGITSDAQPFVSVLKQDGPCFAMMAGDDVDPALGISGICPYHANTQLLAGIDFVQVIIDYGAEVEFAGTSTAPRPHVTVTIDGVASDEPIEISDEIRVGSRAYFVATFRAPPEASSDVRISAGVNAGFHTRIDQVFVSVAPPVAIRLLDCPNGVMCDLYGATGSAHVHLAVPGSLPQLISIHSELNGVPQPNPVPPVRTSPVEGRTEAITAIPVPIAPPGTEWTISAQLGEAARSEVSAIIRAPILVTRLTCGTTCSLSSGDPVGLEIIAPSGIRPLEAFVTTRLDGVPQLVSAHVPLELRADGNAVGLLGLVAPAGGGTWQIDVAVAGYPAPTLVTTVQ